MKTLSYLFDLTPALADALNCIISHFICFVDYDIVDDYLEVTIRCRAEDAASVENHLAELI